MTVSVIFAFVVWGSSRSAHMLRWALIFFIVAIVAAVFGFGGIAGDLAYIAKILFLIFIVIFLVSLVMGLAKGKTPGI